MNGRYERGTARIAELDGGDGSGRAAAHAALAQVCPDLPRLAVEFAYGDVHARPGLDAARRELVTIGALIALGDTERQLRAHLGNALGAGLTSDEIIEAVLQTLPYTGFPRVINAMHIVSALLDERGQLPARVLADADRSPNRAAAGSRTGIPQDHRAGI